MITNYSEARKCFQDAAKRVDETGIFESYKRDEFLVPSKTDSDLFVDARYFKRSGAKRLYIISSGVHGYETPLGSAVQVAFLRVLSQQKDATSSYLFCHCLNPWGFVHHRRPTESNVNLNRNFWEKEPPGANPEYAKYRYFFEPHEPVAQRAFSLALRAGWEFLRYRIAGKSMQEINQALSQGQYEFPQGLEFGGFAPEPQVLWWANVIRKYAHEYDEVIHLDLHTGLGRRACMHLITSSDYDARAAALFEEIWPKVGPYELTDMNAPGFYTTLGDHGPFVKNLLKPSTDFLSLTVEFGTLGNTPWHKVLTLSRLVLENQGTFHGYQNDELKRAVVADTDEVFLPSSLGWQREVLFKAAWLLEKTLH